MKIICLIIFFSLPGLARDISENFQAGYREPFTASELAKLQTKEVILIPGIMSETFIASDRRSRIDFSIFTKDYFGTHLKYLSALKVPVRRLNASSSSVEETKTEIEEILKVTERQLIFYTHSLGGMALLDLLLERPEYWEKISAIVFMQSPFTGAPVASLVKRFPKLARIFPVVHTSSEVVKYLTLEVRKDYVTKNQLTLLDLTGRIKIITVGGIANGYHSIFSPSVSLIRSGCLQTIRGRCVGPRLFQGPYDDSDGMVPFEGSKLPGTDFVRLPGVDHGETVVHSPFQSLDHRKLTTGLLKLVL
jgi:hypothetical protein